MVLHPRYKHEELRPKLWEILHDGKGMSGHAFHLMLILLIIISLALLPLEFIPQLHEFHDALAAIEVFTAVLFTMEYALRVYAAPDRLRFIFSFYGLVDLFSIAPFYLGILGTQYVRALRILRIIRVLKLGEMEAAAAEDKEETTRKGVGLIKDEKVEYIVTHHPLFLIGGCIPPLVATSVGIAILILAGEHPVTVSVASCLFLFALVFLWKAWLDFSYDVIFVSNRRLIMQNQYILGRTVNQVNYHAITNVKPYYTNPFGYFFRFGSIVIETMAAEPGHIELHMVRHHEKAANVIMEKCFGKTGPLQRQA
jgi:hypothetical protein